MSLSTVRIARVVNTVSQIQSRCSWSLVNSLDRLAAHPVISSVPGAALSLTSAAGLALIITNPGPSPRSI
jgi:hypothetical protein